MVGMIRKVAFFLKIQKKQFRKERERYFFRKILLLWRMFIYFVVHLPFYFFAIPIVLAIRFVRVWFLIRFTHLSTSRIGHFCANTELYLCERDAGINIPQGKRCIDFFYLEWKKVCNKQLLLMWKRLLYIFPEFIVDPVRRINRFLPGWEAYEIPENTQHDRDVHNLFIRYPPHLQFTSAEEKKGATELKNLGIIEGKSFVCLLVRDSAYLDKEFPGDWSYHNFRDANIDNYILAVEELVRRGYFVIRMGVIVNKPLKVDHPQVIDYAWKGLRSEFMDIYLGAKCEFSISTSAGWDTIPYVFRRPIVFTNMVPLNYFCTFEKKTLIISKKYRDSKTHRDLTLKEIFNRGFGSLLSTSDYVDKKIELIENTPEEIRDIVVEMIERLYGSWQETEEDKKLQDLFWNIFPVKAVGSNNRQLHGKILSRFGANYLRNNKWWLQ